MTQLLNDILTLTCHDLSSTGEGVCDHDGYKVFVEGALPGEKITCEIIKKKKNYAIGKLVEIAEASKYRVKPVCPHFNSCGGCQIMHLDYNEQLKLKKERVRQIFHKLANLDDLIIHDVRPSNPSLNYRNKIQMPTVWQDEKMKIGLYQKRSHNVIDIEHCYLHNKQGQKVYEEIRRILQKSKLTYNNERNRKGELRHILIRTSSSMEKSLVLMIGTKKPSVKMIEICKKIGMVNGVDSVVHGINQGVANVVLPQKTTVVQGPGFLKEKIAGITIKLSALSFFQVNLTGAESMYQTAMELGNVQKGMHVIDAYSGVGVFSTLLAKRGARVTAIEVVEEAVTDAKENAAANGLSIDAICGKVEDIIPSCDNAEVVFVNPPRKGCETSVLEEICKMSPSRIVYTSCDPATLARDAKILYDQGYKQIELSLFDMFAQTMHVETIALFTK